MKYSPGFPMKNPCQNNLASQGFYSLKNRRGPLFHWLVFLERSLMANGYWLDRFMIPYIGAVPNP
jgi:hypothetical protein